MNKIVLVFLNSILVIKLIDAVCLNKVVTDPVVGAGNVLTCPFGSVNDNNKCLECGAIPMNPNVKIVGGVEAIPNSYPSQVLIVRTYQVNDDGQFTNSKSQCGGVLINRYTILTAAHCTQLGDGTGENTELDPNSFPTRESTITVYTGVQDTSFTYSAFYIPKGVQKIAVSKIIDHPQYNLDGNFLNDISLLILKDAVNFTSIVQPACLPDVTSSTYPPQNTNVFAAGWGALVNGGELQEKLYNVKLKVYSSSACAYVKEDYQKKWSAQICAGDNIGKKDTCKGDSGGGLYHDTMIGNKLKRIAAGIVSYGDVCGTSQPAVYTRVSYYLGWIKQNWKF